MALLRARTLDRSLIAPNVVEAIQEGRSLQSLIVMKIGREQNRVTDELAYLAISSS